MLSTESRSPAILLIAVPMVELGGLALVAVLHEDWSRLSAGLAQVVWICFSAASILPLGLSVTSPDAAESNG